MAFPEKFKQSLEDLQATVDRKLAQIDALDKSLQEVGQQYVRRCSQEIKEMMQRIRAGHTMPGFSDAALAELRWSLRISDAKVALAIGLSEIVDKHIKQLDQYIEEIEARRCERELSATCSTSSSCTLNTDTPTRSERFQRKARSRQTRAHLAVERPSVADVEMPIDQNECTYCICHEISYGNMICCDNDNCKIEWFHFECVGLKNAPKGKWYCPDCAPFQKDCK